MNIKRNFRNHFFFYAIVTSIFIVGVFSYHRFMNKQDYMVGYEGVCDPAVDANKCFEGCDDDACTEKYYYVKMVKYAPDLYKECGEDITDCESANLCLPSDRDCSATYCDPEVGGDTCAVEINTQNETDNTDNTDNATDNTDNTEEESSQSNEEIIPNL